MALPNQLRKMRERKPDPDPEPSYKPRKGAGALPYSNRNTTATGSPSVPTPAGNGPDRSKDASSTAAGERGGMSDPFAGLSEKDALRLELRAIRSVHAQQKKDPQTPTTPATYKEAMVRTIAKGNGTGSKGIPSEYAGLASLVAELPDDFPIEGWDDRSASAQQTIISRTDLTQQQQWAILNAGPSIETIALIQDIEADRALYGLTPQQVKDIAAELWEIGNLRTGARNHDLPFSHNGTANARFLDDLDKRQQALLDSFGYGDIGSGEEEWYNGGEAGGRNMKPLLVGTWIDDDSIDLTDDLVALMKKRSDMFNAYCEQNAGEPANILAYLISISKAGSMLDIKESEAWEFEPGMKYFFDGMELRQDDAGNMLFGYVGASQYPLWFLQLGAGAYQILSGTSDLSFWRSYFDDPRDSDMIAYGYDLYHRG